MFISRVELLPEDETTAEHDMAKREEAQLIETDRTTRTDGEPGLFKGAFCRTRLQIQGPIHDDEDGVLRCPRCAWEMEDGECGHCGYTENDFSDEEDHEGDSIDSQSVVSISSSTIEADIDAIVNPFLLDQPPEMQDDFRMWVRRDEAARRARRAARGDQRRRRERHFTDETEVHGYAAMRGDHDHPEDVIASDDEEVAAFLERHPHHWNTDTTETVDEDEEMTTAGDEEDGESTTSFHRAAILARDRGMDPPFESDISTNGSDMGGQGDATTNDNDSSDDSTDSDEESNTPEPMPAVQRLATRPARIVIDSSDEDSSSDSSSSGEEETTNDGNDDNEDEEESSDNDSTPSPPRPTAVRHARVQMHRGRRGNRGRGRPRVRN